MKKILYVTDKNDFNLIKHIIAFCICLIIMYAILRLARLMDNIYITIVSYILSGIIVDPFLLVYSWNIIIVLSNIIRKNSKHKKNKSTEKYKYETNVDSDIIIKWIKYAKTPDKIIIKTDTFHSIEITFDCYKKTFIDKKIVIDEKEIDEDKVSLFISCCKEIKIVWYTENNDPQLFIKMVGSLK